LQWLQHLSAMIQDINLAEQVNLLESSKDIHPNDLYSFMINPIKENIKDLISKDYSYTKLGELNITRKLVKIPLMTISYNVTIKGMCEQIIKSCFDHVDFVDNNSIFKAKEPNVLGNVILTYKDIY
jgi:DNA-directed RNA polymerase